MNMIAHVLILVLFAACGRSHETPHPPDGKGWCHDGEHVELARDGVASCRGPR